MLIDLADGTQKEVPSDEELQTLQQKAASVDKTLEELNALKSDPQARNFAQLRAKAERLEAAVKAQGKTVDAEGNVIDIPQTVNRDEILAEAQKHAEASSRQVLIDDYKHRKFNSLPADNREVVQRYFDKLIQGEEPSYDVIDKVFDEAVRFTMPAQPQRTSFAHDGGIPRSAMAPQLGGQAMIDAQKVDAAFNDLFPTAKK